MKFSDLPRIKWIGHKVVEVTWMDIRTNVGWRDVKEVLAIGPALCRTVGYLLRKDRDSLLVVPTMNEFDTVAEATVIPVGNVLRVETLRRRGSRKAKRG